MTRHELKTWPSPFEDVAYHNKRHEIRKPDRNYQPGDELLLREYIPETYTWRQDRGTYTGRSMLAKVLFLTPDGEWGLPEEDVCVMSIELLTGVMVDDVEVQNKTCGKCNGTGRTPNEPESV
jgi:hypothetical protein